MNKESSRHITPSEAAFATISGALLGASVFFPPAGGIGLTVGAIGLIRMRNREINRQLENLSEYLHDSSAQNDHDGNSQP